MSTAACLFRVLQVFSLCLLLFIPPAWAQQSYTDTENDSALTSQDVEDESDDGGRSFEQELADIDRHYADLVPDHAKSATPTAVTNDRDDDEDEDEEEE